MPRGIFCALGALGILLLSLPASAGVITICSDVQPILDFPDCDCGEKLPAKLPFAMFSFAGQPKLAGITSIRISLTMQDGDTGVGQLDYNNLTLGLDSVDTGLKLNGFNAGEENSLTFQWDASAPDWPSQQKLEQLLADMQDGIVTASILDATPDDNAVNLYSVFDTQLCLTGPTPTGEPVPEPASLALWSVAGGWAALRRWRRKRRGAT